ncbi:MAG TPA: EamA family transporter, partial [Nitrospirota bacterium]
YAVLGLVHSTAGVMMYLYGIRRVSAQEAGVLGYLEPVLGILLAFMFLGETPHMFALAGGAMIIMSGTMIVLRGVPALAGGVDDYRG